MLNKDTNKKANKLIKEKSPYLLQHAYNPVDWYSWGEEAFKKAKKEDKPIFLSIGYSSCHWCHVMERESFEDNEVAEVLNKNFISIKVDREERPDIDSIYMTACQALTGSGGWPLTIFMTPEKKPFYAGTYFPKNEKYGMPGLLEVLDSVIKAWEEDKERLVSSGNSISNALSSFIGPERRMKVGEGLIANAFNGLEKAYDPHYGGFGTYPKFPSSHNLLFLLKYYSTNKEEKALHIAEKTLQSMYKGGIFDHVGYGFARYSVDEKWLVPHFEKMLYDNALLSYSYCEAYSATKEGLYREVAEKTFQYVLREMTSKEGGFYCAEDADSEGVEGKFYVWSPEEVKEVLGIEQGEKYCDYYDITEKGNFEGKNIPNLISKSIEELKNSEHLKKFKDMREKLFQHREKRVHPAKDDKILTSWNGLMIAALAYGGKVFKKNTYIEAAEKACKFIENNLVRSDGRLLARYRDGDAAFPAYIDDYAFFIWALIELYEATFNVEYLKKALDYNEKMINLFWDKEKGGFYLYGKDSEEMIIRPKEIYDGAIPSGNSSAAHNLVRLYKITGDEELNKKAQDIFETFGGKATKDPLSHIHYASALLNSISPYTKVVISGEKHEDATKEMLEVLNESYDPFRVVILNDNSENIIDLIPSLKDQKKVKNKATAYVCKNFACREPVTNKEDLIKLLSQS